jgi:DNA-binding NtrC family response regulator
VRVESAPGQGTVFRVYLPRAVGAAEAPAESSSRPRAAVEAARVLLVEDDRQVRGVVARTLRRAGHLVHEAHDVDEALAWVAEPAGRVDVLVTDLVMPRLGGQQLAARIRALAPGVKVLFVSGYSAEAFDVGQLGPDAAFLQKPFTAPALLDALEQLVAARGREAAGA